MSSSIIGFWLILQMVMEVVLCGIILCYIYREKSKQEEVRLEKERMRSLVDSLDHLIAESEDLDRKHQKVLKLWEKIEKRGAAIEAYIENHEKKLRSFPNSNKDGEELGKVVSGVASYERASHLIEKGLSVSEIAHKVGLPPGEVELITNLKRQ